MDEPTKTPRVKYRFWDVAGAGGTGGFVAPIIVEQTSLSGMPRHLLIGVITGTITAVVLWLIAWRRSARKAS